MPSAPGEIAVSPADATDEAAERVAQALTTVGLEESGNHLIEEFSGGQQQHVALARAFASRARLLVADEPMSDLDAVNRGRMVSPCATRRSVVRSW